MNITPWFVTGFVEGEGAFTYNTACGIPRPCFSIRQRADYWDIVHRIREFFGVGTIYNCRERGKTKASTYYRIVRAHDLPIVLKHFRFYPIQSEKKRRAFEAWKRLVLLWLSVRGKHNKMGAAKPELARLAEELSLLNVRPRPGKRIKHL